MYTHIVLFKLKDDNEENVKFVADTLKSMEGNINLLREVQVGVDELNTERSFDIILTTKFDSLEDMNAYQVHPYHVNEVLAKIKPYLETSKVIDYSC